MALDDGEQGLAPAILDFAEVLFWWGHVRHAEVNPERGREIVARIRDQGMTFVAIHSAHFATPFMEAMNERTRADERRTPASDVEKGADGSVTVRVQMPLCVFPAWKAHGLPSTVRVISIRPGHETFPIYDDAHMLRLVENVARTSRAAATP